MDRFHFGALNKAALNVCVQIFGCIFSFFLCNYLGMQWLGYLETAMLFFTVLYFMLLPIMYESSSSSTSSPIVLIVILFNFRHFSECAMVFLMVLIYIYLMTKDVVLIGYHISFLVKDIILIYSYLVSIYIYWNVCLCDKLF